MAASLWSVRRRCWPSKPLVGIAGIETPEWARDIEGGHIHGYIEEALEEA